MDWQRNEELKETSEGLLTGNGRRSRGRLVKGYGLAIERAVE
jgi:hypothetical protein